MDFFARLENRVKSQSTLLCVGLDPHPNTLPSPTIDALRTFCLRLIEATSDLAAAFKPNTAFFEAFGPEGWQVLREVIASVPNGIPVILDAKRGDIASTAEEYTKSAFEILGAHCITLSPYLGKDSIDPFIIDGEKGVFLLCKTSNPGSKDFQDITLPNGDMLYEYVAKLAQTWNTKNNIGLVVGATYPEALARVRAAAPDLWFLAPGVGAQGGDLEIALKAGLRKDGLGMLITVSRGISQASNPAKAAANIRDEIINVQNKMSH